jgi:DNA helicase-2/ATP-dependent DNA helicase PcrA
VRPRATSRSPLAPRIRDVGDVAGVGAGVSVRLGQRVAHATFGEGIVTDCEGSGAHARVQVNFERAGSKWLVLAYANLAPL